MLTHRAVQAFLLCAQFYQSLGDVFKAWDVMGCKSPSSLPRARCLTSLPAPRSGYPYSLLHQLAFPAAGSASVGAGKGD